MEKLHKAIVKELHRSILQITDGSILIGGIWVNARKINRPNLLHHRGDYHIRNNTNPRICNFKHKKQIDVEFPLRYFYDSPTTDAYRFIIAEKIQFNVNLLIDLCFIIAKYTF